MLKPQQQNYMLYEIIQDTFVESSICMQQIDMHRRQERPMTMLFSRITCQNSWDAVENDVDCLTTRRASFWYFCSTTSNAVNAIHKQK